MESEPEFCRDVIETRVKEVFREHLKISRDMPFTQVIRKIDGSAIYRPINTFLASWPFTQVYRMEMPCSTATGEGGDAVVRPIVVAFRSARDRDNILRLV